MTNARTIVIVGIFFIIGITGGWQAKTYTINKSFATTREIHSGGYRFINPLLQCEFAPENSPPSLAALENKLHTFIDKKISSQDATHISLYFRDLNNGPWFGINENENFSPASLLKVPLMIAYYKEAEAKPESLKQEIPFLHIEPGDDNQITNFKPSQAIVLGQTYTIDELIKYMIVYSDNDSKNLLALNLDDAAFIHSYRDLGIDVPDVRKPEDFMSVKSYASFFRILYNASYLSREYSEKALSLLSQSEFKDGIVKKLPPNTLISHKFGERKIEPGGVLQLHDCGIIYQPQRPYLLCIMTRGGNFSKLSAIIADTSDLVYKATSSSDNAQNQ